MYQKIKQKLSRGSILGATLIILGLMLVSSLSFSLVSIQERKASMGENKSNQAFQTASTGTEIVLQAIKNHSGGNLIDIDSDCDGTISSDGYAVQLQADDGSKIADCSSPISAIKKVKSVGTAGQNQRAIEVQAAGTCVGGVQVLVSGSTYSNDNHALVLDFINNNKGKIIGLVCNFGDTDHQDKVTYYPSSVSVSTGVGGHVYFRGDFSDNPLSSPPRCKLGGTDFKCMVADEICDNYTILGSCTCENSCGI